MAATVLELDVLHVHNENLQGDNFSDELRQAGLSTPNRIVNAVDFNESVGGPFKRDKVWFWFSTRYNQTEYEVPVFANKNAYDPTKFLYEPDPSTPGANKGYQVNNSLRVTWQASPRNKIAGTYKFDKWCNCPNNISATVAPEAGRDRRFPRLAQEHFEWTSPVTNKLLFEAVALHLYERWGNMHYRVDGGSLEDPALEAILPQMISVTEQSNNLTYRSQANYNNTEVPSFTYRAAGTYVTGSHAFKVGFNNTQGHLDEYQYTLNNLSYRFNNGVPNRITERAFPYTRDHQPRQRSRSLCAGSLVGQSLDHPGSDTVRLLRHELPGTDRWAVGSHADSEPHLCGAGQHLVEGHHLSERGCLRSVRHGQDSREGRLQQVPPRPDAQRARTQPEPGADAGHPGESSVERSRRPRHQRRLRPTVQPPKPAGQR